MLVYITFSTDNNMQKRCHLSSLITCPQSTGGHFTPVRMMSVFTSSTVSEHKPTTATDTAVLNEITHFTLKVEVN